MSQRLLRILIGVFAGIALAAVIAAIQIESASRPGSSEDRPPQVMAGSDVGGDFTLTDHTGERVTQADYADKPKLIYFGFTYCPSICPTELQKMARALEMLGDRANDVHPLFVTVDPERDTPKVMREYVQMFHPALIGLTGSVQDIEAVKSAYKIYASKVKDPAMTEYTMDHSSFIYLMSADNRLVAIFRREDKAGKVAEVTRAYLDKIGEKSRR